MQHRKIFPTNVGLFEINDAESIKEGILEFYDVSIDNLNFGKTSKDIWDDVTRCPALQKLHDIFLDNASQYVNKCYDDIVTTPDYFFHERGWITHKVQGTTIPLHNHRQTSIAGVYYFDDYEDNAGDLHFIDPRTTIGWMHPDQSARHDIHVLTKPKNGTMMLFPGWLMHFSPPNNSSKTRLSIGVNINMKPKYIKVNGRKWEE